ncbi:MAG TPA: PAS domain-containing protein [Alphaproteobacteria bacterium]|nr:PAS domain-containing protein [Alphaproteobacteria bacterium]
MANSAVAASVMESVASRLNGFFYRCQNDPGYTMLVMTDGIAALTGYPAADFLNNRVRTFTSIVSPDDTAAVDAAVGAAIESRGKWEIDYRLIKRDGGTLWIHESGAGIFDEAGQLLFLEGACIDISLQKDQEQKLADLIAQLSGTSNDIVGAVQRILKELRTLKLLALNARIEAVRAAEHGVGFAVVAEEMKALTESTRGEADRISELMDTLQRLMKVGA